jgi:dipeptidyl aminopeptidase/acylaminoacyl peptidase
MDTSGGHAKLIYRDPQSSIDNVEWSADGRWLLFLKDSGGNEVTHLYRLDPRHPGPPIDLTPIEKGPVGLIGLPKRAGNAAIVTIGARDPERPDVYRIQLSTGRVRRILLNTGETDFYTNELGAVRAASTIDSDGTMKILARRGSAWVPIYSAPPDERLTVLGISPDGRQLIVRSNRDRPTEQLLGLDLAQGAIRSIVAHECGPFDADQLYWDSITSKPAAVSCTTDRARIIPLGSSASAAVRSVQGFAGRDIAMSLVSLATRSRAAIFSVEASDRPTRYVVFSNGHANYLPDPWPWLAKYHFSKSVFERVSARDGLSIPVYVTRAEGSEPRPTVVLLHGGPWDRDREEFNPELQQLVNRGFSVLQVNYRGSTGFGRSHWQAGVGQFGRAMSDDVVDALSWAVTRGITDPNRVCIMGGSYGGYATLIGMTRDAARFRCGIDFAGPTDLVTLIQSFPPDWKPYLPRSWYRFVGDPENRDQRAAMMRVSPLYMADRIRAPLLIFQGQNDPRVTKPQSDSIVDSARRRGVPVVYLVAANEGHGFGEEQTNLAVKRAVELFLAKYLGGRAQQRVGEEVQRTLDSFLLAGRTDPAILK